MMSTVSVHIVTFNSAKDIQACLEAVLQQSWPIERIIVVDNASTDGTRDIVRSYADRVELVQNDHNNGFAGGHNQAIAISSSAYCLILNPDVTLSSSYVERLLKQMGDGSQIGSVTGRLLLRDQPDVIDSAGLVMTKARRAFDRGAHEPAAAWTSSGYVFGVSGAAALYNRRMIEDIGLGGEFFDEDFFAYKEDVDVAWRAQLAGWKAYYEAEATALHSRGWKTGSRKRQSLRVRRLSYINRYKMIVKNDKLSYIARHLLPLLIYELPSFAYFLIREPAVLKAWVDFLKMWPQLRSKRRYIQTNVRAEWSEIYRWLK